MRLLTWNVWFEDWHQAARAREVLRVARMHEVDVLALQEVTPEAFGSLWRDPWLRETFALSTADPSAAGRSTSTLGGLAPYGCLLAVRRTLGPVTFHVSPLTSRMNRTLVHAEVGGMLIATTHLESLANARARAEQLSEIADVLGRGPSILSGDLNFCARRNWSRSYASADDGVLEAGVAHVGDATPPRREVRENDALAAILPAHTDAWPALRGPEAHGFTFDTVANATLRATGHHYEQMRYDRHLVANLGVMGLALQSVELVGQEPIAALDADKAEKVPVCASDHFGLLLTLGRC